MYIALLLLMLCPSIALADAAREPSFELMCRLNDLLNGTPHFFYVDVGYAADGTKGDLVVICDEPTPEIMSRTPETYGGYPVKIKILKEWQEYWKYSFPGDVPPGCTNDNRRMVCPKAKPAIIDPTPGVMARDPRYPGVLDVWRFRDPNDPYFEAIEGWELRDDCERGRKAYIAANPSVPVTECFEYNPLNILVR